MVRRVWYKVKKLVLWVLWDYGLIRGIVDDTANYRVSGGPYYFRWPKKRNRPPLVEIKDFPMRHAYPEHSDPTDTKEGEDV